MRWGAFLRGSKSNKGAGTATSPDRNAGKKAQAYLAKAIPFRNEGLQAGHKGRHMNLEGNLRLLLLLGSHEFLLESNRALTVQTEDEDYSGHCPKKGGAQQNNSDSKVRRPPKSRPVLWRKWHIGSELSTWTLHRLCTA